MRVPIIAMLLGLASVARAALPDAARQGLQVGDCAQALAWKGSIEAPAERLAVASCALLAGQHQAALELAPRGGSLGGYGALVRGEALLGQGQAAAAAAELGSATHLPGEAGQRASMLLGRSLVESGRPTEGRDHLRPLLAGNLGSAGRIPSPGGADPAEVRWWLAQNAVVRGQTEAAVPVWKAIWTRNPTSPRAHDAALALVSQGVAVPGVDPGGHELDPTVAGLVQERISTLRGLNLYPEALALHDLLPLDGSQAGIGRLARLCFLAKDYPRAVELYARLSSPSPNQRFNHALAMSRTGDYAQAATLYRRLVELEPGHSEADQASFKLGYLHYDAGELEPAITELRAHLQRYPKSAYSDSARWFIAWSLVRLERLDEAASAMGELAQGGALADGGRYWSARIAGLQGKPEAERKGLEDLLKRNPDGDYAWFASQRLGKRYPARPLEPPPQPDWAPEALQQGRALAAVGLDTWARAELASARSQASTTDQKLLVGLAMVEAGDYRGARDLSSCRAGEGRVVTVAQQLCTPRPHGDQLMARTLSGGLDRHLPFAIMNAESGLRPEVTSPAGARGLMQLMPTLAETLHVQRYPGQPYHPDALYQPGYNATLGTMELVGLRKSLAEAGLAVELPMVIAGYNGGAEAVLRWSAEPVAIDVWSENVGYTETRRYVKRVLGYLMAYRQLYGDG